MLRLSSIVLTIGLLISVVMANAEGDPYKEGNRDYYSGLCYRARPYLDGPADKAALWGKGYNDAKNSDSRKNVDWSHCFPGHTVQEQRPVSQIQCYRWTRAPYTLPQLNEAVRSGMITGDQAVKYYSMIPGYWANICFR